MKSLAHPAIFLKSAFIFIGLSIFILSSCSKSITAVDDEQRILFLKKYGITVDKERPYYNSQISVPEVFSATWEIRDAFAKDMHEIDISKFKKKQCGIFMYPVSKLPFQIKKDLASDTRAVIITCGGRVICSYIEFISETRSIPPVSLSGKSITDITGVKWDTWKVDMESDDNKKLVIWKYYECLKSGSYEEAYSYIFDKAGIKKEEFIKAAGSLSIPDMDFLNLELSSKLSEDKCSFAAKANVKKGSKSKTYNITFDLKKDPSSNEYGGWKIVSTSIK